MATAGRRPRFGVVNEVIDDQGGWLDHVRRIEDTGAATMLIRDHVATAAFGPQLAPLSAASAAAAHTTRLKVGTMVLSNDYRHPALVAHEAATIDSLSGGRFELGMGAGWLSGEYAQMGIPFDAARNRIDRLEESVQIIAGLLAGQVVSFRGAHYAVESLQLPITPAQRPHLPLLIGAGGRRMLELAARHADIVGILPAPIRGDDDSDAPADRAPAALTAKLATVEAAAGQRFGELELSIVATFEVTSQRRSDTEALIQRRGWQGTSCEEVWAMPSVFIGSAEQIAVDLDERRSRYGVSYYVSSDQALDHLARVIAHVGP